MKQEAVNTFTEGLVMDLNPLTTPNNVLTNCLNGTVITFDGNEFTLQNDSGNGRVETAYLPEGYVPVGLTEFGGIIYIVSYNPITDKSQIGSFPSPERNISSEEVSDNSIVLSNSDFGWNSSAAQTFYVQKDLYGLKLNPGDKFIIYADLNNITSNINKLYDAYKGDKRNKVVQLSFATITDEGKIVKLTNIKDYQYSGGTYIIPELTKDSSNKPNLDSYRSLVSSPYNIFNSRVSGKLLLIAELITVNSFDVIIDCEFKGEEGASTKDVDIIADMSYESDGETYLYGVNGIVTSGSTNYKSLLWETEDKAKDALLYTVANYDYINRPVKNVEWSLTPCMSFGPVSYLTKAGILQLDKVGTGFTNLSEWRYYVDNNSLQLNWSLQSYPEPNHTIKGVRFIMSCYPESGSEVQTLIYNVSTKRSYNGAFTEIIPFDSEFYKIANGKQLAKNRLYYVTMEVQYSKNNSSDTSKYKYFHRFLYTADIFNKDYIEGKTLDFTTLYPTLDLQTKSEMKVSFVDQESKTVYGKLVSDAEDESTYIPDIESLSAKQLNTTLDMSGEITPSIKNDYDIFDLDPTSVSVNIDIDNTENSIVFGDYSVSYTGVDSAFMDTYLELKEIPNYTGTVPELPATDKTEELINDKYGSGVWITNPLNTSRTVIEGQTSIPIKGVNIRVLEHIKAFAKLENKVITFNGTLSPVAHDKDSFARYRLYKRNGHFAMDSVCAYCQYEAGGDNGFDVFTDISGGGFGTRVVGAEGNGLSSDVLWDENQSAMRDAWVAQTGPIAVAVWTQNRKDKSSALFGVDRYGGWAWDLNNGNFWEQSGNTRFIERYMGYMVFFKRTDDKFGLINMAGRVGTDSYNGWGEIQDMPFAGTRAGGIKGNFYNIYTCIAALLNQVYRFDGIARMGNKIIPSSVYYISKYNTDYGLAVKTKINNANSARIRVKSTTGNEVTIDSTMKDVLFNRNRSITGNRNDTDENNVYPNIDFSLLATENTERITYTTINSGIELRDRMLINTTTNYGVYIRKNNGTVSNSIRSLETDKVYYVDAKGDPVELDSSFRLYGVESWDLTDDTNYTAKLSDTVVSGSTNFSRMFKLVNDELRIDPNYVKPAIRCNRRQGGKGDNGSVGNWAKFAPFDFLRCFN